MNLMDLFNMLDKDTESLWKWVLSEGYIEPDGLNETGEPLYKVSEKGGILLKKGYEFFSAEFQKWKKNRPHGLVLF